jgi:4-hydroxythreonine-4-phosphate dehydrogenase
MKIGITLGDPSGIGPEIVRRTLEEAPPALRDRCIVFGDLNDLPAEDRIPGRPSVGGGRAQVAFLEAAVEAARRGAIQALVTAPISKAQCKLAGFSFPGHTEFLAERLLGDAASEVAMLFAGPKLKVVLATIHHALADVPRVLTSEAILRAIRLGAQALVRDFGIPTPRIGVLGLNPHAGEGGIFGAEEARVIAPAIAAARQSLPDGCVVEGPLVPDAAFRRPYDLFVAMYHDQGLIPVKLVDFDLSVNVTLGLPIVRTSPDHGVAYDIAGKGLARHESLAAALTLAADLMVRRSC